MKILWINYLKTYWINWVIYKQNITIDKELMDLYNKHLEYLKNKINDKIKNDKTLDNNDMDILRYTIDLDYWINYLKHTWLVIFWNIVFDNWIENTKRLKFDRNTIIIVK